jgi:hypothetical protein
MQIPYSDWSETGLWRCRPVFGFEAHAKTSLDAKGDVKKIDAHSRSRQNEMTPAYSLARNAIIATVSQPENRHDRQNQTNPKTQVPSEASQAPHQQGGKTQARPGPKGQNTCGIESLDERKRQGNCRRCPIEHSSVDRQRMPLTKQLLKHALERGAAQIAACN